MIELRSKHYKFIRRDILIKLCEKYRDSGTLLGVYTSSLHVCGVSFTLFTFEKYKSKKLVRRKTYVEFLPQNYHLLKNVIKLEQLYNVPLIGEGIST